MDIFKSTHEMENQPKQPKRMSQQVMRAIQDLSRVVTLIFLLTLVLAIYQAFVTGNPLPVWAWLGIVVLFAVAVGLLVALVVYRGVVKQVGPLDFRPSGGVAGELVHETQNVEAGKASSLQAEIKMVEGILQLAGGTTSAMDASFTYDNADWKPPQIQYAVNTEGQGRLIIEQPATHRQAMRQGRCEWVIHLNGDLPTDLRVKFGAGKAELRLAGLALSKLRVESGVGGLDVDFSGEWQHSLEAFVKTGIGDTVLRLPQDAGVRIQTEVSLGSTHAHGLVREGEAYFNAAYGKSPVTLDIRVESGMGKLTLK